MISNWNRLSILTLQRPHHSMRQSIGIAPVWCINAQCFKSRTHVAFVVSSTHCGTWRSSMSISYLTFSSQRTPWNSTAERKKAIASCRALLSTPHNYERCRYTHVFCQAVIHTTSIIVFSETTDLWFLNLANTRSFDVFKTFKPYCFRS